MESEWITRINALARKKRTEGLTPEEKTEQHDLRIAYLRAFRTNMRGLLDHIHVEQEDGTYLPLKNKE